MEQGKINNIFTIIYSFFNKNHFVFFIIFSVMLFGAIRFGLKKYNYWKESELENYGLKTTGKITGFYTRRAITYCKYEYQTNNNQIISASKSNSFLPFNCADEQSCIGYKFEVIYSSKKVSINKPYFDRPVKD